MKNNSKKPNTPGGVYIPSEHDREQYEEFRARLLIASNQELVEAYNGQKRIYGVRSQMIFLNALHQVFLERFDVSPMLNEDTHSFSLGKRIYYSEELDTIVTLDEN